MGVFSVTLIGKIAIELSPKYPKMRSIVAHIRSGKQHRRRVTVYPSCHLTGTGRMAMM